MVGDDPRIDESGQSYNRGDTKVPDDTFFSSHDHHTSLAC